MFSTQANNVCLSYNIFYYYYYLICVDLDWVNRCRWCPNTEEHLIYVKYDYNLLNILDAQKGVLTLKNPILLEKTDDGGKFHMLIPSASISFYQILVFYFELLNNLFALLDWTKWIDPCQANSNLLATGGSSKKINVYDKRNSQIVKTFEDIHSGKQIYLLLRHQNYYIT